MIGTSLHLEFPDCLSLEEHLHKAPYVLGRVWENIDIRQIKPVPVDQLTAT